MDLMLHNARYPGAAAGGLRGYVHEKGRLFEPAMVVRPLGEIASSMHVYMRGLAP